MSEGEIIDCNKNEKHKTVIILLFFTFAIDSKIKKLLQINARNNDGEKPANQTNNRIEKGFAKKTKLQRTIAISPNADGKRDVISLTAPAIDENAAIHQ